MSEQRRIVVTHENHRSLASMFAAIMRGVTPAPPHVRASADRILDGEARRLLDERGRHTLDGSGATGLDGHAVDRTADQ